PRLDVGGTAALRFVGDEPGESLSLRALLRLDAEGSGAVGLEGRREAAPDRDWTGLRATGRFRLAQPSLFATELELVIPDDPRDRGQVWPWGSVALGWNLAREWEVAGALQASAGPEFRQRLDALCRLSHRFEGTL